MTRQSEIHALTADDFGRLLADLPIGFPWALAVSGGSDSVALMVLAAAWAKANNQPKPTVLTVDHGLRSGAAAEARQVAMWASAQGLECKILTWTSLKPQKNIQSQARDARYRLLGEACVDLGARFLLTAHTKDDQAETVLLRLARGSGVDGLAAMRAVAALPLQDPQFNALRLARPLLTVTRSSLRATLEAAGQPWLDDPSNDNPKYARVRMRKLLAELADEGLDVDRLAKTAALMNRARQALNDSADHLRRQVVQFDNAGFARVDMAALTAASEELGLRTLAGILLSVGGAVYRPRLARLERLFDALRQDLRDGDQALGQGATLSGCRVVRTRQAGSYLVVREMAGLRARLLREPYGEICIGERQLWDNRFEVALSGPTPSQLPGWGGEIRPLGRAGMAQASSFERSAALMKALPPLVRPTLPALWVGDRLVAAPHLGLLDEAQFSSEVPAIRATFMAPDGDEAKRPNLSA